MVLSLIVRDFVLGHVHVIVNLVWRRTKNEQLHSSINSRRLLRLHTNRRTTDRSLAALNRHRPGLDITRLVWTNSSSVNRAGNMYCSGGEGGVRMLCNKCKARPAMHTTFFQGKKIRLCCQCYMAYGNSPADWHPECMRIYENSKKKTWHHIPIMVQY